MYPDLGWEVYRALWGVVLHPQGSVKFIQHRRVSYLRAMFNYGERWRIVLKRYGLSKSVCSPGFLPYTGSNLAESALFHFTATEATSLRMRSICWVLMSPGNGTVSKPVPQTAEYASKESTSYVDSAHRCANSLSSKTGTISPE